MTPRLIVGRSHQRVDNTVPPQHDASLIGVVGMRYLGEGAPTLVIGYQHSVWGVGLPREWDTQVIGLNALRHT